MYFFYLLFSEKKSVCYKINSKVKKEKERIVEVKNSYSKFCSLNNEMRALEQELKDKEDALYNANEFLDSFPYQDKPTYSIEHLIGLRHRDSVESFKEEVDKLMREKTPLTRNLARWVTRNYIVNSRNMKSSDRQSLNSKVLNHSTSQSRLIAEQHRNEKKH